jgi:Putative zinc-finger
VDNALPNYMDETLDAGLRRRVDEHLAECLRCNALLRDINAITALAAHLPELVPSRDLWNGISARIEPTVLPFGVRATRDFTRRWAPVAAAAAAVLVVATAGVTYFATSRLLRPAAGRVAVSTAPTVTPAINVPAAGTAAAVKPTVVERSVNSGDSVTGAASLASRSMAAASPSELAYGDEIERLQKIIADRRHQLDPATVLVIEQNLKIIDAAVKQSRAALAHDPKSGFLTDQLNNALDKKVELLRTVVLLPSST